MASNVRQNIELMTLYWTTSGVLPGVAEISPFDFRDRVEAAARAGFCGIGLWHTDLEHVLIHYTYDELRRIIADNGIRYLEIEFLTDWFAEGARRSESDSRKKRLLEASAELGAKHVKVGDFYNAVVSHGQVVDAFAALCADGARFGATIGFEFMASSMIHDLDGAIAMVRDAGAPNGGIILDIVHAVTLGIQAREIAAVPSGMLINVELNDGVLPGHPSSDLPGMRRYCGEGEYDITGFIRSVLETGYAGPWAVEVYSNVLVGKPLDELNRRAFQTTRAALDRALMNR